MQIQKADVSSVSDLSAPAAASVNVLAYVHMRRVVACTGAGRVARCLTENLCATQGVRLRLLADRSDYNQIVHKAGPPWTGMPAHLFDRDTSMQQAQWILLGRPYAETFWPEADVVFCASESYVPVRRAKLAVTLHDAAHLEPGALPRDFGTMKHRLKWRYLFEVLQRKADMFHTVSHFSAERLSHYLPGIRNRLRVVHNGVANCFFNAPSSEATQFLESGTLAGRPYILLPSGLHHRKNADLVLKAWPVLHKLHPEWKLVITSTCDPSYLPQVRSLGSSVKLLGFVSDDILCALYRSAICVWFPSLYEGFGMPVLEAMACGTPVVASDVSAIPEIAGEAALLVPPKKPEAHVDAICAMAADPKLAARYSQLGVTRSKKFTWRESARQMQLVFQTLK